MNETKEATHTAEPWQASGEYWTPAGWLGIAVAGQDVAMARDAEYQRRIVAAVNACAGLSTEALEAGELARLFRWALTFLQAHEPMFGNETDEDGLSAASEEFLINLDHYRAFTQALKGGAA